MKTLSNLADQFIVALNKSAAHSVSPQATELIKLHDNYSSTVSDLVAAMRQNDEEFIRQALGDKKRWEIAKLYMTQVAIVGSVIPKLELIEDEINALKIGEAITEQPTPIPPTVRSPYKR